jgi:hypothetical protein
MNILLAVLIVQSLNLVIFTWFNREAGLRILVLRQQLIVLKRKSKKPMLRNRDRLFWSLLSKTSETETASLSSADRKIVRDEEMTRPIIRAAQKGSGKRKVA